MKRKISLFLAATLIFSTCLIPTASAAALETAPSEESANLSEAITPRAYHSNNNGSCLLV